MHSSRPTKRSSSTSTASPVILKTAPNNKSSPSPTTSQQRSTTLEPQIPAKEVPPDRSMPLSVSLETVPPSWRFPSAPRLLQLPMTLLPRQSDGSLAILDPPRTLPSPQPTMSLSNRPSRTMQPHSSPPRTLPVLTLDRPMRTSRTMTRLPSPTQVSQMSPKVVPLTP